MRKLYFLFFIIGFYFNAIAQKEANNWYFGDLAGITFNSGAPVALTNGQLNTSEGCSSISDPNGNLLFYTDGITVWNKNHAVMTNGNNLRGDPSSTQSGIIVPKPGSTTIYYIFTVDMQGGQALFAGGDADGVSSGFRYSEVDMAASGGLGAIVVARKNVALSSPTTEGLSAVKAANGIDYWVVVHGCNNNRYSAFNVTAAGVNTVPVISNVGPNVTVSALQSGVGAIGYMKISPNGKKIAACHGYESKQLVVSDFNTATGAVSNSVTISINLNGFSDGPYGVEFSNCNEYLYVSEQFTTKGLVYQWPRETRIWRFDPNAASIVATKTLFQTIANEWVGALQLAADGKIYCARVIRQFDAFWGEWYGTEAPTIHAINNPRIVGATFTANAVNLAGRHSVFGLPPFIASFFYNSSFSPLNISTANAGSTTLFCNGDSILFNGSTNTYDSLRWYFGDPASGALNNTSTLLKPKHLFSGSGTYTVTFYKYLCGIRDSVIKPITIIAYPVINNIVDQTICTGSSIVLNGTAVPVTSYSWNTGAITPTITVNTAGKYVVTANNNGCIAKDSMNLTLTSAIPASVTIAGVPNPICVGTSVTFTATPAAGLVGPSYQWYKNNILLPGETNSTYVTTTLANSDQIKVILTGGAACITGSPATSNIIIMTVNPKPTVTVTSPTICAGNTASLTAGGASTYTWTGGLPNGATVTTPILNSNTSYTVTGTDGNGCKNTAVATVTVNPKPTVTVTSPSICTGNTATLTASGASTYTWTGGLPNGATVTTPILNSNTSYTVTGTDGNNCKNTAVATVTVNSKPTVTVTSPTICSGNTATLTAGGASTYTWTGGLPNGSTVTTPILNSNTNYTVTGTDGNNCTNTAVATVTVNSKPTVTVTSPTICAGTTATLTAGGASTYTWTGGLPNGTTVTTPILNSNTSYTVTGTDGNNCTNTAVATVTVNSKPTVTVTSPTICAGNTATLTAGGASTYTWTGGLPNGATVTTPILSSNTSYTVTGTDGNNCTNTAVATVTVNPKPTVTVTSPSICDGTTATITASGASTYTWTGGLPNGATVTTPILNSNTSYTVTGTDGNNCTNTAVSTVTVNLKPTVTVTSPSICAGNTASLTASGATTYTWTGGLPNGATVTTPILNSNTSYTVTGTDGNNCTNTAVSTVTVNLKPIVTVTSPTICAGNTASLTAGGASTYTWTGGLPNGATVTTPILNSTTSYTVTGSNGSCSNTAVSTVTVNPKPTVTVTSPTICAGNTASLTAGGASTYTWTGGLPNGATVTTPILNSNTSYTVTGTDGNNCTNTAVATVTVNPKPTVTVTSPIICAGNTASLTAGGATTYTWTGGLPNGATVTTPILNSTTSYTVTGTDGNNCMNTAVSTVTVNPNPTVTVTSPTICSGQTATLSANGASTYTWTGGLPNGASVTTPILNSNTSYTVTGTDGNNCTNTAVSTVTVTPSPNITVNSPTICAGLSVTLTANGANTYTWSTGANGSSITVSPGSTTSYSVTGQLTGCPISSTAIATVTVNPKPTVTVTSATICTGNTASLTASGASTYTWTGGLPNGATVTTPILNSNTSYTVTGTDVNNCTNTAVSTVTVNLKPTVTVTSPTICAGNTASLTASGATTYTWSGGLPNGATVTTPILNSTTSYTVTGTDVNNCTNTAVSTVTVNPKPTVTVTSPSICAGNTASLTASGASTYTWTGGLPNGAIVTTPILNSNTSYTVTGTDGNNCSNTATATVTVNPKPTMTVTSPSICTGNTASLTASGASTYTWTGGLPNGATVTTPILNSNTSYTVTGTDGNGCTNTATATVTVNAKPTVTVNSPSICDGTTASLAATGATTYTWTGGLPNGASVTTPILNSTTSYTVTGTDGNSCTNTAVATVTVNPKPMVTVNSPKICTGNTASLSAGGASTYTWTGGLPNGATVTTPILNSNTSYTVTGTDGNNCSNTATSTITVNPKPTVTVTSPTICAGNTASLTASGATTYTWTGGLPNGATVITPILNSNTNYTVTGTDGNNCTNMAVATVAVNPVKTTNIKQTICEGQTITIGGQTFPSTGIYSVKLQSSKGCDSTVNLDLTVNPQLLVGVSAIASQNNICDGSPVTFTATPTNGGTSPQYQWYLNGMPVGSNSPTYTNTSLSDSDEVWVQLVSSETCIRINPAVSEKILMKVNSIDYTKPVIEYCAGDKRTLDLNIPQSTYTVIWKNGNATQTTVNSDQLDVNNTSSGSVQFTIQFGNNCQVSDAVAITVNPLPVIDALVDRPTVKYEQEVQLDVTGSSSNEYVWTTSGQLSSDTIRNPRSLITSSVWFIVTATDSKGCRNTDSLFVNMIDECDANYVFVPTGFSPNRDGTNDCFGVLYAPPMTEFKMVIFDRWGEKLFETTDVNGCWDGTYKGVDAMIDSYSYVIGFRCYNGKFISRKGMVTLVR